MAQRSLYRDIYELQLRPQEEIVLDGTGLVSMEG
jgi:hypothetical protein